MFTLSLVIFRDFCFQSLAGSDTALRSFCSGIIGGGGELLWQRPVRPGDILNEIRLLVDDGAIEVVEISRDAEPART